MKRLNFGITIGIAVLVVLLTPAVSEAQGTLFVEGSNVGIGTPSPNFDLHVFGAGGNTQFRVQEDSGSSAARNLFTLVNNGGIKFTMLNTHNGTNWNFNAQANFNIDLVNVAGNEFQLQSDGDVVIKGMLIENSSRTVKRDFDEVSPGEILQKVAALPITTWRYQYDDGNSRHLGPVAEDFYAAFGLGEDDKHITPSDKAGVALAAVQGLYQELETRNEQISRLQGENEALKYRLKALEAAVSQLSKK